MPTKHQKEVIALAKEQKTNVMRILDKAKIPYTAHYYEHNDNEPFDGVGVAKKLGQDPALVYKTLVTIKRALCFCNPRRGGTQSKRGRVIGKREIG